MPLHWTAFKASRAHRDAEAETVGGFQLHGGGAARGRARELRILGVQKLAIVEAVPKLGASAGGSVEFVLQRLAQSDVVDGERNANLRCARASWACDEDHDDRGDDYPQPDP